MASTCSGKREAATAYEGLPSAFPVIVAATSAYDELPGFSSKFALNSRNGHRMAAWSSSRQIKQRGGDGQSCNIWPGVSQLKHLTDLQSLTRWSSAQHRRHIFGCVGYHILSSSPAMYRDEGMTLFTRILAEGRKESTQPEKSPEVGAKRRMGDSSKQVRRMRRKNQKTGKKQRKPTQKKQRRKIEERLKRPAYPRLWQETKHKSLGGSPVKAREKRL